VCARATYCLKGLTKLPLKFSTGSTARILRGSHFGTWLSITQFAGLPQLSGPIARISQWRTRSSRNSTNCWLIPGDSIFALQCSAYCVAHLADLKQVTSLGPGI